MHRHHKYFFDMNLFGKIEFDFLKFLVTCPLMILYWNNDINNWNCYDSFVPNKVSRGFKKDVVN